MPETEDLPRRTEILPEEAELSVEDLIVEEDVVVTVEVQIYGDWTMTDSMAYDALFCAFDQKAMGLSTESYNARYDLTREEQDAFSARSHQLAATAQKNGVFDDEDDIVYPPNPPVPYGRVLVTGDEIGAGALRIAAGGADQVYPIDVPSGSTLLSVRIGGASDSGADLDLYLYDGAGADLFEASPQQAKMKYNGSEDNFALAVGFRTEYGYATGGGLDQGPEDPLAQQAAPHRGPRVVEHVEQGASPPAVGQALHELEVAPGEGVEDDHDVLAQLRPPLGDLERQLRHVQYFFPGQGHAFLSSDGPKLQGRPHAGTVRLGQEPFRQ